MADEPLTADAPAEPIPAPEASAPETPAAAPETPQDGQEPQAAPPEPPKRKDATAALQGRVGHLTKTLHEKDAALAEAQRRYEALQALLNARPGAEAEPPVAPPTPVQPQVPAAGTSEFQEAVAREAARQAFVAEANRVNAAGKQQLGAQWDEALGALNAMGVLQQAFVEAAIATGNPVSVLSTLGGDLEEAARIASLPPIQMAVELTRMASPKPAVPAAPSVSGAPAPIRPLAGAVNPQLDIGDIAKKDDMAAYVAARKAQGSPFAR